MVLDYLVEVQMDVFERGGDQWVHNDLFALQPFMR